MHLTCDEKQALLAREQREFLLAQYYPYYAAEFGRCHALGCPMYLAVVDEAEGIWVSSGLAHGLRLAHGLAPAPRAGELCLRASLSPRAGSAEAGPAAPSDCLPCCCCLLPLLTGVPPRPPRCHRHPACLSSSRARRPPPPPLRSATTRSGSTWTR